MIEQKYVSVQKWSVTFWSFNDCRVKNTDSRVRKYSSTDDSVKSSLQLWRLFRDCIQILICKLLVWNVVSKVLKLKSVQALKYVFISTVCEQDFGWRSSCTTRGEWQTWARFSMLQDFRWNVQSSVWSFSLWLENVVAHFRDVKYHSDALQLQQPWYLIATSAIRIVPSGTLFSVELIGIHRGIEICLTLSRVGPFRGSSLVNDLLLDQSPSPGIIGGWIMNWELLFKYQIGC